MMRQHVKVFLSSLCAAYIFVASAAKAEFIWGINGHPLNAYSGVSAEEQLDYVKDLGLTSYRVNISETGQIDELRRVVDLAKERGLTILPVITPPFDLSAETPADLEKKSYDLAMTIVSAFKDEIAVWELGNEMENFAIIKPCERRDDGAIYNCGFGPAGGKSPLDYYGPRWQKVSAVLKGLSNGSRAADPKIRRAIGTAGWGHTGAFERIEKDGIGWEISVWHQYGLDPEWAFQILAGYKRPIWVTEFNHPLGSQKSDKVQSAGLASLVARLRQLRRSYNVEAAFIYQLMDESYFAPDFEANMGLVHLVRDKAGQWKSGGPKPAYHAAKDAIAQDVTRGVLSAANPAPDVTPPPQEPSAQTPINRNCTLKDLDAGAEPNASHVISYAYCLTLGREPDGHGMRSWLQRLRDRTTVATILVELMHSDEFTQNHELSTASNVDYVAFLNHLLLDQTLTAAQRAQEQDALEKTPLSRAEYQRRLIGSAEFKARHAALFRPLPDLPELPPARPEVRKACAAHLAKETDIKRQAQIDYGYCLILGRNADPIGLQGWAESFAKGLTVSGFLQSLLQSAEFESKYSTPRLGNGDYVTLMYRLLLERDPSGDERDSYLAPLDTGRISRADVSKSFVTSDEFRAKQQTLFAADRNSAAQTGGKSGSEPGDRTP